MSRRLIRLMISPLVHAVAKRDGETRPISGEHLHTQVQRLLDLLGGMSRPAPEFEPSCLDCSLQVGIGTIDVNADFWYGMRAGKLHHGTRAELAQDRRTHQPKP